MTGADESRMLIALDVDGTIVLEDESMSPGVEAEVTRLDQAGHIVTLATGRGWPGTWPILERLGIEPEYVVSTNGAVVMKKATGDDNPEDIDHGYVRWAVEVFDASEALKVLEEALPDARFMVETADGSRMHTASIGGWTHGRQVDFHELGANPVCRVVAVATDVDEVAFHKAIAAAGFNEVTYAIGYSAWLDIAPLGVTKATGLRKVAAALGHPTADVMVVGDGNNDIGMFRWAAENGGRAVAMGQATAHTMAAATELTDTVQEGGLAKALATIPG